MRLVAESTLVLVVDVQEKLAAAMPEGRMRDLQRAGRILLTAARVLGAGVILTEQYPRGLGKTLTEIDEAVAATGGRRFEKLCFSAASVPGVLAEVSRTRAVAAVVFGLESHVCVWQTARDLVAYGLSVHVPADGVASRRDDHRDIGLELCRQAGATVSTAESIVFDWLGEAGTDAFRAISRLVRD